MGSYLRIYLKDKENKMTEVASFRTSSSEIYSTLRNNCNIEGMEKYDPETKTFTQSNDYTEITTEILSFCIDDLKKSIDSWKERISTYYKLANKFSIEDACMEIVRDEEYLDELKETLAQFNFIYRIVDDIEQKYTGFTGVFAQVG